MCNKRRKHMQKSYDDHGIHANIRNGEKHTQYMNVYLYNMY